MLTRVCAQDYREAIEQISTEATQEAGLEAYLQKVIVAWQVPRVCVRVCACACACMRACVCVQETYFVVLQYKDPQQYKEVYILGGIDDIFVQVRRP